MPGSAAVNTRKNGDSDNSIYMRLLAPRLRFVYPAHPKNKKRFVIRFRVIRTRLALHPFLMAIVLLQVLSIKILLNNNCMRWLAMERCIDRDGTHSSSKR